MNRSTIIFPLLFLILLIPPPVQCIKFSIGLCYETISGATGDKDQLKFTTGISYPIKTNQGTFSPEINLLYNTNPGLLGDNGHVQAKMDIKLPSNTNPGVVITKELLFKQINETIDYNPEKNKRLKQQILLHKQMFEFLQNNANHNKATNHKELSALIQQNNKLIKQIVSEDDFNAIVINKEKSGF